MPFLPGFTCRRFLFSEGYSILEATRDFLSFLKHGGKCVTTVSDNTTKGQTIAAAHILFRKMIGEPFHQQGIILLYIPFPPLPAESFRQQRNWIRM